MAEQLRMWGMHDTNKQSASLGKDEGINKLFFKLMFAKPPGTKKMDEQGKRAQKAIRRMYIVRIAKEACSRESFAYGLVVGSAISFLSNFLVPLMRGVDNFDIEALKRNFEKSPAAFLVAFIVPHIIPYLVRTMSAAKSKTVSFIESNIRESELKSEFMPEAVAMNFLSEVMILHSQQFGKFVESGGTVPVEPLLKMKGTGIAPENARAELTLMKDIMNGEPKMDLVQMKFSIPGNGNSIQLLLNKPLKDIWIMRDEPFASSETDQETSFLGGCTLKKCPIEHEKMLELLAKEIARVYFLCLGIEEPKVEFTEGKLPEGVKFGFRFTDTSDNGEDSEKFIEGMMKGLEEMEAAKAPDASSGS